MEYPISTKENKVLNILNNKRVKCEVYSRVVGYFRPVGNWNAGKQEEYKDRLEFNVDKSLKSKYANDMKNGIDSIN